MENAKITLGTWRQQPVFQALLNMTPTKDRHYNNSACQKRHYFMSEGEIEWQYRMICLRHCFRFLAFGKKCVGIIIPAQFGLINIIKPRASRYGFLHLSKVQICTTRDKNQCMSTTVCTLMFTTGNQMALVINTNTPMWLRIANKANNPFVKRRFTQIGKLTVSRISHVIRSRSLTLQDH
nr:unnamed protein product [Callosobruchus analis]